MKALSAVMKDLDFSLFGGAKVPHGLSHPIVRYENGEFYFAVFAFGLSAEKVRTNQLGKPSKWALADLESGEIKFTFSCMEKDFSPASEDILYDMSTFAGDRPTQKDVEKVYEQFEAIRSTYVSNKDAVLPLIKEYMEALSKVVPTAYFKFYKDLSNI